MFSIAAMFVNLDSDRDQALSKWELSCLSEGNLTPIFVDRLIDEFADTVSNAGPALSYHAMLEYMLAAEHRRSTLGIQYYWRVFDVEKKGRLTLGTLNLFLRDINAKMGSLRLEVMPIENMTVRFTLGFTLGCTGSVTIKFMSLILIEFFCDLRCARRTRSST